jgi:hypothetical protein
VDEVIELMERAAENGIRILHEGQELRLVFAKGRQIDRTLLLELGKNKARVMEYLTGIIGAGTQERTVIGQTCEGFEYEGRRYYGITDIQQYWVNEDADKEYKEADPIHGTITLLFRISGKFDPQVFKKAVRHVIWRHESLRTTFHKIGEEHWMRIEDDLPDGYETEIRDAGDPDIKEGGEMEHMLRLGDRRLSLSEGPLFMSRIMVISNTEHILSLKLHHVVSDTWSNGILLQDLLLAYRNLIREGAPLLQDLKYQFKDFLAYFNAYKKEHCQSHRAYWENLFTGLPPAIVMPRAKDRGKRPLKERIPKRFYVKFPDIVRQRLETLAKEHGTTLFVVLQASYKSFLFRKTGISDILIATYVAGRDHPDTYWQIGCYSTTNFIRTIFKEEGSFRDAIGAVKKANHDMGYYRAFTLIDAVDEMRRSREGVPGAGYDLFWKVTLLYLDASLFHANEANEMIATELNIELAPIMPRPDPLMNIDMYLEFMNLTESLSINVRYDSTLYDEQALAELLDEYLDYVGMMTKDTGQRVRVIPVEVLPG